MGVVNYNTIFMRFIVHCLFLIIIRNVSIHKSIHFCSRLISRSKAKKKEERRTNSKKKPALLSVLSLSVSLSSTFQKLHTHINIDMAP